MASDNTDNADTIGMPQVQAIDPRKRYCNAYSNYDVHFPPLPGVPVVPWPPVPVWPARGLRAAPDGSDQTATKSVAYPEDGGFACCMVKYSAQFLWRALIFAWCLAIQFQPVE